MFGKNLRRSISKKSGKLRVLTCHRTRWTVTVASDAKLKENLPLRTNCMFRFLTTFVKFPYDFWIGREPTRTEVVEDLKSIEKIEPVVRALDGEHNVDAVRAYYEHTTYRDYKILEWLGADGAMHTPLAREGPHCTPFLEPVLLVLSRVASSSSVLEVGCGKGANTLFLKTVLPSLRMVAVDLTPSHVQHARLRASDLGCGDACFVVADAGTLTDEQITGNFDTVFGIESLCYLSLDAARRFLAWAHDHLNPGGEVIVIDGFKKKEQDEVARACAELAERGFRLPGLLTMTDWRRLGADVGLRVAVQKQLTREALPFWSRWWRVARLLLYAPRLIYAYAHSKAPRRRETLANFAAVLGTAPSLALGATEYGMLVFRKPTSEKKREKI